LQRRWLRWHSFLLASVTFAVAWGASATLMRAGVGLLALRWPLALVMAYTVFIGLLWLWCRWLLSREQADGDPGLELPDVEFSRDGGRAGPAREPAAGADGAGGGGGGGGGPLDADAAVDTAGDVAGSVLEAAASADEGIVIAVPLAVVAGIAALIAGGLGVAVFGLFGVEVLLGVAVEIAIAAAGGALAYRARREGWLAHALSRTIKPMLILLLIVVALGAVIDHWMPQAGSLPRAVKLLSG
jgi:hypothetical protein